MKLKDICDIANAVAPSGIEPEFYGNYSAKWIYTDPDGDKFVICANNFQTRVFIAPVQNEDSWYLSPDVLIWLGTLGGLMLQLDKA